MKRTFKGFLRSYCRYLSGIQTDNLKTLCTHATTDTPRLTEALFLFALEQDKLPYLLQLSTGTRLEQEYRAMSILVSKYPHTSHFLEDTNTPERYRKVWNAYLAERDAIVNERRISALMREKTLQALSKNGLTPYRICKELNLNLGNVYAYLHKGDTTKVSRETARRIMEFATE